MVAGGVMFVAAQHESRFERPRLERTAPHRSYRYLVRAPWGVAPLPGREAAPWIRTARGRRRVVVEALRDADVVCRENVRDGDAVVEGWGRFTAGPSNSPLRELGATMYRTMLDLGYLYWSAMGNLLGASSGPQARGCCERCGYDEGTCGCSCRRCGCDWERCACDRHASSWRPAERDHGWRHHDQHHHHPHHHHLSGYPSPVQLPWWSTPHLDIQQGKLLCKVVSLVPPNWWAYDLEQGPLIPKPDPEGSVVLRIRKSTQWQPACIQVVVAEAATEGLYCAEIRCAGMAPQSGSAVIAIAISKEKAEKAEEKSNPRADDKKNAKR
jgi:hypothetical protein